uniref:Uncharacterized protein n=1 Tax=Arundo donax TaxID=35708 RepID=A0A0A8YN80_ARUDO
MLALIMEDRIFAECEGRLVVHLELDRVCFLPLQITQ